MSDFDFLIELREVLVNVQAELSATGRYSQRIQNCIDGLSSRCMDGPRNSPRQASFNAPLYAYAATLGAVPAANPATPTSGECRHDFRKGTVANCIHCGECGYADPSTPLATPAQAGADQGGEWVTSPPSLYDEIRATLNRHSAENGSNTPDYVLASFLADCLQAFDTATNRRHAHYNGGQCG